MSRSTHHLGLAMFLWGLAGVLWMASAVQADVGLCRTWTGTVKAREGSCGWGETEIALPENTDTLADLNCSTDQIAKYDGTRWVCSDDPSEEIAALKAKTERLMQCLKTDRYVNLGPTVFDCQTWLEWEKKTSENFEDTFTWSTCDTGSISDPCPPNGTAFDYIASLNTEPCFANKCDWRLPEVNRSGGAEEFETILLEPYPTCVTSPCIDPIFGPTAADDYWTSVTAAGSDTLAWYVDFHNGYMEREVRTYPKGVRAVRTVP